MAKLYRIKPVDKKSIYMVYECYKEIDGKVRWFNVRELYRWGQGFRELDEPVYAEDTTLYVRPELGWGCELDDGIAIDFEFDDKTNLFVSFIKTDSNSQWMLDEMGVDFLSDDDKPKFSGRQ